MSFSLFKNANYPSPSAAFDWQAGADAVSIVRIGDDATTTSGLDSIALMGEVDADNAIAIGVLSEAKATGATAVGKGAFANGLASVAIGLDAQTTDQFATVVGSSHASSVGDSVTNIGAGNTAGSVLFPAAYAIAIGESVQVYGSNHIAIGSGANCLSTGVDGLLSSVAIGTSVACDSTATSAVAIGNSTEALAPDTIVIGKDSVARSAATGAVVIGRQAESEGQYGVSVGQQSYCNAGGTVAVGYQARSEGTQSVAIGELSDVNLGGNSSIAIGHLASVSNGAGEAVALGYNAQATLDGSIAIGNTAVTQKINDFAVSPAVVTAVHGVGGGVAVPANCATFWGVTIGGVEYKIALFPNT